MKIKDLEEIKRQISEIKSISDKLDYVTSTAINQNEYSNFLIANNLNELTVAEYKIIDFGKMDEEFEDDNTRTIYFFIKYTS